MTAPPAPTVSRSASGLLDGLIGVAIFSGSLPATRIGVAVFDPASFTAARALIAAIAAGLYLWLARRPLPAKRHLGPLILAALTLVFGFPWLMALATVSLGAAHGAVILGLLPLATAVAAVVYAGERPSLAFWGAALVGAALVATFTWRVSDGTGFAPADLVLLFSVAVCALGYAVSGVASREMSALDVMAWALVIAAPVSLVMTLVFLPGLIAVTAEPKHWAALLYVGVMSQFLGFWFWNKGLAIGGVARVGQVQLLQTFFTLALAALLLGERITLELGLFAVGVAATVLLARRARVQHR